VKKRPAQRPDDTVMESPSLAITSPTTTNPDPGQTPPLLSHATAQPAAQREDADRTEDQVLAAIVRESGWQPVPIERVLFPWAFRTTRLRRTARRSRLAQIPGTAQPASPPERTKP